MQNQFNVIPQADTPRSTFDLSHNYKTTLDADYLYPVGCFEVLPGDTWSVGMTIFARMTTPIFPIMDVQYIDTYAFFVPCRILWENWERFNGAQTNPGDSTDYRVPTVKVEPGVFVTGSIYDYFGLPVSVGQSEKEREEVNALPFRAYNLIFNEWFRDQNLQDSLEVPLGDTDLASRYKLVKSNKAHDYFTSCLPFPQKGPGVEIPIAGGWAPVRTSWQANPQSYPQPNMFWAGSADGSVSSGALQISSTGATVRQDDMVSSETGMFPTNLGVYGDDFLFATINTLRMAWQIQRLYERDARGGTRYWEILRSHFNVTSPDSRLQRPEFLGYDRAYISQHVIPQTSSSDGTTPQGNLGAFATSSGKHSFSKSFVEHGFIIVLSTIRSALTYDRGIDRMWSRRTRFDYFWPVLQHIGEQAVLNKELSYIIDADDNDEVFGYMPRYEEYKFIRNKLTGLMRTYVPLSLKSWHLAQDFGNVRPNLNSEFIESRTPMTRVLAIEDQPHFLFDSFFSIKCSRVMSTYSIPGLVDHF